MKAAAYLVAMIAMIGADSAMAGNVQASIQGGSLYIYGNNDASNIAIDSPSANRVRIRGRIVEGQQTTVNSRSTVVELGGWTGGVFVYLYGGTDIVNIVDANIRGAVHLDVGLGNDDVILGQSIEEAASLMLSGSEQSTNQISTTPLILQSSLFILGLDGNDYVQIDNTRVYGRVTADLGNGSDEVYVADSVFSNSVLVLPGAGQDIVDMFATDVALDLIVDDHTGKLTFDVADVGVGRNAFIYGTSEPDFFRGIDLRVANLMQVFGETADDSVNLGGQARTLEIFAGIGNDQVRLNGMSSETVRVFLDSGADLLVVSNNDLSLLNAYGGSDNDTFSIQSSVVTKANIYGDGGTDTFTRSSSSINSLNLYSIEIR